MVRTIWRGISGEWVSDWYDPNYYRNAPTNVNPTGPEAGDGHVLKGGGWAENLDFTRCANRLGGNPGSLLRGVPVRNGRAFSRLDIQSVSI